MNRLSAFAIALAAIGTTASYAGNVTVGDISVDPTPFVSTLTGAQVRAQLAQPGPNVWATNYNPVAQFQSQRTRAAVTAEFLASRGQVQAMTGEDSGSVYLARAHARRLESIRVAARAQ